MNISAIILAAGKSVRMGQQKMLMPWGNTTVLGKVIDTLQAAGIEDIVLVTNSKIAPQVTIYKLRVTFNDGGEMLTSIQLGLQAQKPSAEATLICLGDQPQVEERSVRNVSDAFRQNKSSISYQAIKCGADIPGWSQGNYGMRYCKCVRPNPCAIS